MKVDMFHNREPPTTVFALRLGRFLLYLWLYYDRPNFGIMLYFCIRRLSKMMFWFVGRKIHAGCPVYCWVSPTKTKM